MHHKPFTRRSALVARSMRDILWHIDLIPGIDRDAMLERIAVIHRAVTFQEVSNCLDALVLMDLCLGARWHRQHV